MHWSKKIFFVVMVLILVALAGCGGKDDTAADAAKIEGIWDEYTAATNAGDIERWLALWTEDGLRVTPSDFGPRQHGKEEIRAIMEPIFAAFSSDISIDWEDIVILGEQAYSYGTFVLLSTPKDEGDAMTLNGNFMTILEKQEDGSWKILIDTWNY